VVTLSSAYPLIVMTSARRSGIGFGVRSNQRPKEVLMIMPLNEALRLELGVSR
jgi:hypothetical protein